MISSISGSNAAALLAMFSRPQTNDPSQPAVASTSAPLPPPPSPGQGLGTTAHSLFDAILHASQTGGDGGPLENAVQSLFTALDSDGDGALSADELNAAAGSLLGSGTDSANSPAQPTLYESLFAARAGLDGGSASAARVADVAARFTDLLKVAS